VSNLLGSVACCKYSARILLYIVADTLYLVYLCSQVQSYKSSICITTKTSKTLKAVTAVNSAGSIPPVAQRKIAFTQCILNSYHIISERAIYVLVGATAFRKIVESLVSSIQPFACRESFALSPASCTLAFISIAQLRSSLHMHALCDTSSR
jgi:hypothetical protein